MATYSELRDLFAEDDLRLRLEVATVIAAEIELQSSPGSDNGRRWALNVLSSPAGWGRITLMAVLAANKSATVSAITSATDATIQTAVDNVVPELISAWAVGNPVGGA